MNENFKCFSQVLFSLLIIVSYTLQVHAIHADSAQHRDTSQQPDELPVHESAHVASMWIKHLPVQQAHKLLGVGHRRRLLQDACSTTDGSAAAILACANAVRVNPDILSDASCFDRVQASVKTPHRKPLSVNASLNAAASSYVTAWSKGGAVFVTSLEAAGYKFSYASSNLDVGYQEVKSARDVVLDWFCADLQRNYLFACEIQDVGTAVLDVGSSKTRYYAQFYGCPSGKTCNSCVAGTSGGGSSNSSSSDGGSSNNNNNTTGQWTDIRPMQVADHSMCLTIRNAAKTAKNGVVVQQAPCDQSNAQKFTLFAPPSGGGWNVMDSWGRCLDVSGGNTTVGAKAVMWKCNGTASQKFWIQKVDPKVPDVYRLRPHHVSNKCLGVTSSSTLSGAAVDMEACKPAAVSQRFMLSNF
ncbi:hypothetical protein Agub_g8247 [Astrephomene gubernaculifera]|uniref:Ricin B lectin domain-containing protein n=1 Tax=Astrephomene gubernaculifera TaxID=47775 RepID=A0AAD3DVK8_9CHLO|nr:hypothetical protein Agub_g8247 [Astrephomene gubernaculifera]